MIAPIHYKELTVIFFLVLSTESCGKEEVLADMDKTYIWYIN